ncbi:MAG: hypothetical protein GX567_02600, partial [Clostridia bacterium]|nr:hypothetical protein [Clostridia bacterium]
MNAEQEYMYDLCSYSYNSLYEDDESHTDAFYTLINFLKRYGIGTPIQSEDGSPVFELENEKPNVTTLKSLANQIVSHGSTELLQYVEKLLPLAVDKKNEELIDSLFSDIPHLSELLANLFYYVNKNGLDFYYVIGLMNDFSYSLGLEDSIETSINWVFYLLKQSVDLDDNEKIKYIVYDLLDTEKNDSILEDVSSGSNNIVLDDLFSWDEIEKDAMDYIINNIINKVDDIDKPVSLKDKAIHFLEELTKPTISKLIDDVAFDKANKKLDDIIDSYENVINMIKQNFDSIWSELQKSYAVLKAQDNDLLNIYYSDYISANEKNKEDFKNICTNKLVSFFNKYPTLLSNSNYNTVNEFVKDYLNDPEHTINSYSNNTLLNGFIKNYINTVIHNTVKELPAKNGRSWRIEDSGNNVISDYSSDTVLYTGKGDDLVYTGNESSIILGGEGNDTIIAGNGNDELYGDSGDDYISVASGHNYIYGGEGIDYIYGGTSVDEIFGGAGDDTIYAGDGEDKIHGGDDVDEIHGGEKNDWIYGDEGSDTLYGDGGRDTIDGGIGDDTLYGNGDNDTLRGREGNDTLNGGFNDDSLYGGDNSDTYHFYKSGGNDIIYDKYGSNTIVFDGVDMSDISIAYTGTNHQNLLITITSTNDTLKIIDYKNSADNFKYKFEDNSDYYTIEDNEGVLSFSKIEGNNLVVRYGGHWEKQHDDNGSSNSNRYSSATAAQPPRDPLVIDLGTSGINLSTVEAGVHFDIDKNGFAEKTAWTDGEDGFLALDRNGNDIIDDGGELFSDHVIMSDGRTSSDGFEALADLDEDGNGIIDANDSRFTDLRVWIDSVRDGFSADNEIKTLAELGITSIVLPTDDPDPDDDEVEFIKTGSVIFEDGVRNIQEHWFEIDGADTQEITVNNVENDLTSFGNMHSLSYALEHDGSGELQTLVDSFKNTDSFIEKRIISRKILYFITGSKDITVNSRGGAIDARNLHVLETIMGVDSFTGVNGSTTPNSTAVSILNQLFTDFDRTYFNLMNKVLGVADYLEMIEEEPNENGEIVLDLTSVEEVLDHYISLDIDVHEMLYNIGIYVKTYDTTYGTAHLNSFISHYPDYAAEISAMVNGNFALGTDGDDTLNDTSTQDIIWAEDGNDSISTGAGNDIIYGGAGNDTINTGSGDDIVYAGSGDDNINGSYGNDIIYGEDGNDTINSGYGDDIIHGGKGNDIIYEEGGNDTYIFNLGDGNDTIFEDSSASSIDSVIFGEGISADDITVSREDYDMILSIGDGSDSLRIKNFYDRRWNYYYRVENFIFADGTTKTSEDYENTPLTVTGSGIIRDFRSAFNNDSTLIGSETDDEIYSYEGNDTLIGGKGNDTLYDESGNDTYIFNLGDGNDIIYEDSLQSSVDRIIFGEGISAEDITVSREDYDMILNVGDNGDSIRIKDFYDRRWNYYYRVENFIFADGTTKTSDDYENTPLTVTGSGIIRDFRSAFNNDSTLIGSET